MTCLVQWGGVQAKDYQDWYIFVLSFFASVLILPQQILTKFILQITNMFENQNISARIAEFENNKKKNPTL